MSEIEATLIRIITTIGIAGLVVALFLAIAAVIWDGITGKSFQMNTRRNRYANVDEVDATAAVAFTRLPACCR